MKFLAIVYVVLWILMALAAFVPAAQYPYATKGGWVIAVVLFGIIGYMMFNDQIRHTH